MGDLLDVYHMDDYKAKLDEVIHRNRNKPYKAHLIDFARGLCLIREYGDNLKQDDNQ